MGRLIEQMTAAIALSKALNGEIAKANDSIPTPTEGGGAGGADAAGQPVNIVFNETAPGLTPQAFALAQRRTEQMQSQILNAVTRLASGGLGGGVEFRMKGSS